MTDEDDFLQKILSCPHDPFPRLVFADWLEEQGDPRAELIRLLHELTQSIRVPERKQAEERLRGLLESGVQPVGPFITNSIGMKFALIQPGTFMMGSAQNEEGRYSDLDYPSDEESSRSELEEVRNEEEVQHEVTLGKGFFIGVHAVTQACWQAVIGENSCLYKGDELPIESISWDDCQGFLNKLSERDGRAYRLPSEAEWEYACRAGTTTAYHFGESITTEQARFDRYYTERVGSYPANAFGLFDMHGNVWEWCADYFGDYSAAPTNGRAQSVEQLSPVRVVRGGSFNYRSWYCRSAYRYSVTPNYRTIDLGFRVVVSLD